MNAIPLPVRSALAGQRMTRCRQKVTTTSMIAQVRIDAGDLRETRAAKWNSVCPSACSRMKVAETCSRGSFHEGSTTG